MSRSGYEQERLWAEVYMNRNSYEKRSSQSGLLRVYTLLFLVMSALILSPLILEGRSLVLGGDPVAQHLRALAYYGRYLRALPSYLWREHAFPAYSLALGYGSDVLTTLHYYVIGDPLNLFSAFVPAEYTAWLYSGLILLRMYLAGLAFFWFCGKRAAGERRAEGGRLALLAGALSYVFCSFVIYGGWRHPFFLNPMICFPLLLGGTEQVRKEKKYGPFLFAVTLSAASNFYFFYMLVLLSALYVLFRCVRVYGLRRLREAVRYLLSLTLCAVTGVLLSSPILWPVIRAFLNNPRSVSGYLYDYRYADEYYVRFPGGFLTFFGAGDWVRLGFSVVAVLALVLLLLRAGRQRPALRPLRGAFLLLTLFLLIPFFGYVLNGGAYVANRWVWAYILLICCAVTALWEELPEMKQTERLTVFSLFAALFLLSFHPYMEVSRLNLRIQLLLGVLALLWIVGCQKRRKSHKRSAARGLFALLLTGIAVNCLFGLVTGLGGMAFGYRTWERVAGKDAELFDTETAQVRKVEEQRESKGREEGEEGEERFFRYSGKGLSTNASAQDGVPSTQFYWSLANGAVARFFEEQGLCYSYGNAYAALDDRTILNEIAGVKYFYTQEERHLPFGYRALTKEENPAQERYPLYENRFTLPLGFLYPSYLGREEYDRLDIAGKQEILLHSAVLEEAPETAVPEEGSARLIHTAPEFSILADPTKVRIEGNTFTALEDKVRVKLRFEGSVQSEAYLYLKNIGFRYEGPEFSKLPLRERLKRIVDRTYQNIPERLTFTVRSYCGKKKVMQRKLTWFSPKEKWYAGRNSFLFPSGYQEEAVTAFTLELPVRGVYRFEELGIYVQPLGQEYQEKAEQLRRTALRNVNLHLAGGKTLATACVEGDIQAEQPGILCLQLAWSEGWSAQVDGAPAKALQTDTMFTGVAVGRGTHHVRFIYRTPGSREGGLFFLAGALICLLSCIFRTCSLRYRHKARSAE